MSRAKPDDLFKAFTLRPFAASTKTGEVLDLNEVMRDIKEDVIMLTELTNWHLGSQILKDFRSLSTKDREINSKALGWKLGIRAPQEITKNMKSGASRFSEMLCASVIDVVKSWSARIDAVLGVSDKYVSQGWKRTASLEKPEIVNPKMRLSATNKQYAYFEFDPIAEEQDYFILNMVIRGQWTKLYFNFDINRFSDAYKITKPDITLDTHGLPVFHFTAVYSYNYTAFSEDYVISVDVGLSNYVTVSVVRRDGTIVEGTTTTLSADVLSIAKKVRNANIQVSSLYKQGRKEEAVPHRKANVRRKRELAIRAAREIATISKNWNNAIAVFEDLSWIENTMQNGRWNRGELVKWTRHFVELNGGRVATVDAAYTSQQCHLCGGNLVIVAHHDVWCDHCGLWMDRDENATGNIGQRFIVKFLESYVAKRKKSKRFTKTQTVRVEAKPITKRGRNPDRTKFGPTPKRPKRKRRPGTRQKVFTASGLEVTARKTGSSKKREEGGGRKKQVSTVTVKSSHNRKVRRRYSSCSLIQ